MITDDAERDRQMVTCASWLENKRGLLSIIEIYGAPDKDVAERLAMSKERGRILSAQLASRDIVAFAESLVVPHVDAGLDTILQCYSIGSLRPNMLMLAVPPPGQVERRAHLARNLRTIAAFNRNLVIYKGARLDAVGRRRIDLWWHGQKNGSLMALLAYLCSSHPEWRNAQVRLIRVVSSGVDHRDAEQNLDSLTNAARLAMEIDVILSKRPVGELIVERSASADLVLLGLAERDILDFDSFLASRDEMLAKLPPTLLVLSNGEVDLLA